MVLAKSCGIILVCAALALQLDCSETRRQQPGRHPGLDPALPAVAAAVGGQAEVLLDGGIRRGGDVVEALALGARAVMIGRACLWGLAAGGPAGVRNVFDILRAGIDSALLPLGRPSVQDLKTITSACWSRCRIRSRPSRCA